jgi:hypothetical protein
MASGKPGRSRIAPIFDAADMLKTLNGAQCAPYETQAIQVKAKSLLPLV